LIPKECKRLAEVDFPIAVVSKFSSAEKESRCGHIPKIHIWPAARPTGACRAILLALLLPDPCDSNCPDDFKLKARKLLPQIQGTIGPKDDDLRKELLQFIGDFASWSLGADAKYVEVGRALVEAAHPHENPFVVDPFAGGGAIPLEALRLGCDALASELNPMACLIQRVVLGDIPRHGPELADALKRLCEEIKTTARAKLRPFYPCDDDDATPISYLWARTVRCEAPNCGAEIPLVRSFWLCRKPNRKRALRSLLVLSQDGSPQVEFQIFEPRGSEEVPPGTVNRAKATCPNPKCRAVLPAERVRAQLASQRGGADVLFDSEGNRVGGARLLAVVTLRPGERGRFYRLPTEADYQGVFDAQEGIRDILAKWDQEGLCPIPNEPTPAGGGSGAGRAFSVRKYGMSRWADLFTARQNLALVTFSLALREVDKESPAKRFAALVFSKMVDMNNNLATWQPHAEIPAHMLTRFAIPMKWDFAEAVPISDSSGTMDSALKRSLGPLPNLYCCKMPGDVQVTDATLTRLPDASSSIWFTDPPYYDAVPYADISDFFYVWMKRVLPNDPLLRDPFDSGNSLTPKTQEIVQDETKRIDGRAKDRVFFEEWMCKAFCEGRRVLRQDGIGSVVFAHKTTEGWEALLSGMIKGGWVITGSWPIATEMGSRLRARDSAALATSIHLVCRPRVEEEIGDWGEVLGELPNRVGIWMERLQGESIRGADLVFACIGPALEIYSRYSKVEDAAGHEIPLGGNPEAVEPHERGFLSYVWETVGRVALEQVLGTAEAKARNGAAGAVEEDARLTALFLWTLQSTNGNGAKRTEEASESPEEEEETRPKKSKGFSLVFDVVRRFAQPLGIRLPEWEGRITETKKGMVRLLGVSERAKQLFGDAGASAIADRLEEEREVSPQMMLFPDMKEAAPPKIKGRRKKTGANVSDDALQAQRGATTLDRIHAAMLLQASGRSNALRALIKAEQQRGPDFLRLANALSALYPKGSEEKRLVDAMLLAVPR